MPQSIDDFLNSRQSGGGSKLQSIDDFLNPPSTLTQPQIDYNNARGNAEMDESRMINEGRDALLSESSPTPAIQPAQSDDVAAKARQLPIIGPVLRSLDAFSHSPVVSSFDYAAGKAMGVPDEMMTSPTSTGNKIADAAIQFAGGTAGFLTNPTMPVGSVPTGPVANFFENPKIQQIADSAGNKVQSWLPDAGLTISRDGTQIVDSLLGKTVNRATQGVVQGGLGGVAYAPFNTLITGGDVQDMPRNILEQGAMGAGLGGVLGAASPSVGKALSELFAKKGIDTTIPQSAFDEANTSRNVASERPSFTDPAAQDAANRFNFIDQRANVYNDQPLALPGAVQPTTARVSRPEPNIYRDKFENLINTANQMDHPPGRELESLQDLWSRMADRNDPSLDELVNLAYPKQREIPTDLVQRAREQQRQREVAGVYGPVKSASDLKVGRPQTAAEPAAKAVDMGIPTAADGTHLSEPRPIVDVQSKNGVKYYRFANSNTYFPESQVVRSSGQGEKGTIRQVQVAGTNKTIDLPTNLYHGTEGKITGSLRPGKDGAIWYATTKDNKAVLSHSKNGQVISESPNINKVFTTDLTGEVNPDTMKRMANQGIDALYDPNKGHVAYIGHLRETGTPIAQTGNDKAELAQHIRDNLSAHDVATQVAVEKGYNWNDLIGSKSPEPSATAPETVPAQVPAASTSDTIARPVETSTQPIQTSVKPTQTPVQGMRERGHTETIRNSDVTPEPLKQVMSQPELYKTRSTQKLFDDAQKFIEKHGQQGAYDFVMGAKKMTDRHNAVAQIISKQFANSGDISRAIDVVSKTAQHGTELGRAIQSLSLWNRMDTEGALLLAQRQVNKGAVNGEYRALTPEQAKPVIEATQKIQQVEQTKSLADEVLNIVSNKPAGEKLTDAELSKIKEFQKQVTDINSKVKQFLPDKATRQQSVIQQVNKIPPENRTIDDLRNYWDARAERARRKLAAQRNMGLLPNTENPVLLYAELGVAKIAKGALNLADFTDQMVRESGEKIRPIINQVYNQSLNMFRKSQGLPTTNELNQVVNRAVKERQLDPEHAAELKNWANKIAFYTDENLRTEAVQDLQIALRRLDKSTLGQKASALQAGGQLLTLTTNERNVIGNEAFNLLEKLNKITAIPIDWTLSKMTGERSIIFNPKNQEEYWSNWFKGLKGGWRGVSANGKLSSYDIRPEVFGEKNPLKYITKATGATLQSFDHAAYMRAYGDVLATYAEQLGKSQGMNGKALKEAIPSLIKQLDQSIHDMADEAGKYATFQDDTVLSKAAEAIKKGLNYPSKLIGDALVKAGMPESWNPSGFGLGDIVLKYAKTPANVIMRAVDYSPIGIFRGIMQMAPLLTKRDFNQRQAVLALSRGITGTLGLTGLGYYLASQGILTGAPSSDKDVKALQDAAGQKGYQVNLSALQRWIMGGLDKNAAKFQNGDTLINYDWLQPMSISLAMGVNYNQGLNEKKAGVTKSEAAIIGQAILGGLKTIMQQPLVQGVQQVADATGSLMKTGSWSGFANIMKGIPASFVPAISGQFRNFTDNTARSTYDPSVLKSMVNMVINKIPGLAEQLPPQIDSLGGGAKTVVDGGQAKTLGQSLNVFLNPAKVSQYNVSPEAAMVVQLINDTGDNRVAPRVPNRYLMVDKKKVDLTPGQYLQLQQSTSQFTAQQLQRMTPMLTNPNTPEKRKVDAVVSVLNAAGDRARKELERSYPELRPKKAAH